MRHTLTRSLLGVVVAPAPHRAPWDPGDSGSGFMSADGKAVGVLSTLALAPLPASINIGDLARELAFAQANSGIGGLRLVNGTEPFNPAL